MPNARIDDDNDDESKRTMPMMPSKDAATNDRLGSSTASANTWSGTLSPPSSSTSFEKKPLRDPDPYSMENSRSSGSYVTDLELS